METSKLAYGIDELLAIHPGGRTQLFTEIKAGRLIARKLGGRTVVLIEDYRRFLEALPRVERSEGQQDE